MKAKEYLDDNLHVFSLKAKEFVPGKLRRDSNGDFYDIVGFPYRSENHIPFVLYGASLVAIDMVKEQAVDALYKVLENWVHGGDADCIIAEFEELFNQYLETQ